MDLNYGFDKIRFLQPVTVNSKFRGSMVLVKVLEKRPGQSQELQAGWMQTNKYVAKAAGSLGIDLSKK
jgi:acyl dehydratase